MPSRHPLTSHDLDPLLLRMPAEWGAAEIGTAELSTLGITGGTIVGAAMSGVAPGQGNPLTMYGLTVQAGITVLRHEENPRPGEPEGNADHYVITQTNHPDAPYLLQGPFTKQATMAKNAGIAHWHDAAELGLFIDSIKEELR